jgi:hypothetical protein
MQVPEVGRTSSRVTYGTLVVNYYYYLLSDLIGKTIHITKRHIFFSENNTRNLIALFGLSWKTTYPNSIRSINKYVFYWSYGLSKSCFFLSVRSDGHSYSYRPHGTNATQMLCQFQISILHARVIPDRRVDIILDAEYSEYKIVPGMNYVHSVAESNILRVLGTRSTKLSLVWSTYIQYQSQIYPE